MAPVSRLQAGPASGFRLDIQGLRAIAVMLVVLCHAGMPLFAGGYVGVDVFFVISGFLITGWLVRRVEQEGRVPFAAFYAARARRILPAAALVLVVTAIASRFFLNYVRALSALHDCVWATFFARLAGAAGHRIARCAALARRIRTRAAEQGARDRGGWRAGRGLVRVVVLVDLA